MKGIYLFFLLLLIVIAVGGAEDAIQYHGERRYYTVELDGQTSVALHILKEQADHKVKLIFPKGKEFGDIATGIKLSSPSSNGKCEEDHTLVFTLVIDADNHIRGEIKNDIARGTTEKKVKMYLFEKCGGPEGPHYASGVIESAKVSLEKDGRECFTATASAAPFKQHDTVHNEMDLQVTLPENGDFKCQAFMILPPYMHIEDISLKDDVSSELNATWAAHHADRRFWWKIINPNASEPDGPQLPASTSFNSNGDVQIDMLKSTKEVPIVLRIGSSQPIPSFAFKFGHDCNGKTFELYLNRRDGSDCAISIQPTADGYKVTTKSAADIKDALKSPTLIFGELSGKNYVFVKLAPRKANPVPPSTTAADEVDVSSLFVGKYEICQIANSPSVPTDEMVLQVVPSADGSCNSATITLLKRDVKKEIEVLIENPDQYLFGTTDAINPNGTHGGNETTPSAATADPSASAGIDWWWFLIGGLILAAIVIAVLIYVFVIKKKRYCCCKKPPPKNTEPPPVGKFWRERHAEAAAAARAQAETEVKTAIAKTETPKKKSKKNKKTPEKKEKKEKDISDTDIFGPKKNKPKSKSSEVPKESDGEQPKQDQRYTLRTTQQTTTVETRSTQNPSTIEKQVRPKLKYRCMYGPGGLALLEQPFNYHSNESPTYEATINFSALKVGSTPDMKQFDNFWSCIDSITEPKRYSPVFVSSKIPGKSIFFLVRDCVADDSLYLPFRGLSNRMLEPLKGDAIDAARKQSAEQTTGDGGERVFFVLRVFVLSYEPLTLEVHCRGQCPGFIFNVFDCDQCADIGKRLQKNAWLNSQATCREDWETFLCRAKRTPCNNHQFLSYSGPEKPKSSDEVNHVLIVRGNKRPNMLRPCTRGCCFKDMSHRNGFDFQADLLADPTYETQATQQNSST